MNPLREDIRWLLYIVVLGIVITLFVFGTILKRLDAIDARLEKPTTSESAP